MSGLNILHICPGWQKILYIDYTYMGPIGSSVLTYIGYKQTNKGNKHHIRIVCFKLNNRLIIRSKEK